MKSFTVATVFVALLVCQAFAIRYIRTEVYCSETDEDDGLFVELNTTISESGNSQFQTVTQSSSVSEFSFFSGMGVLIANATFSGSFLPANMSVTVIEDDFGLADDGVCKLDISANFSTTPIYVKCTQLSKDGLFSLWTITAKVFEVLL